MLSTPLKLDSCTILRENVTYWSSFEKFDYLNLYFSLEMLVHRGSYYRPNVPKQNVVVNITLLGKPIETENGTLFDVILEHQSVLKFSCNEGSRSCEPMLLLAERQYEYALIKQYGEFNVTIAYHHFNPGDHGSVTYNFIIHNIDFKYIEMVFHGTFLGITLIFIAYWLIKLRQRGWDQMKREQLWISVLLLTLVFYQNPFFIPLMFNQVRTLWILSGSSEMLAVSMMMLFWLLLISGMPGDYGNMHWIHFYVWKCLLMAVFTACTQALIFMQDSILWDSDDQVSKSPSEERSWTVSVWLIGIAGFCMLVWVLWFVKALINTSSKLKQMPYLSTRFRQLSFRFFIIQSFAVVVYFTAFVITRVINKSVYFGIYQESLSNFILFSVYVLLQAFIYLPASKSDPNAAVTDYKHHIHSQNNPAR